MVNHAFDRSEITGMIRRLRFDFPLFTGQFTGWLQLDGPFYLRLRTFTSWPGKIQFGGLNNETNDLDRCYRITDRSRAGRCRLG